MTEQKNDRKRSINDWWEAQSAENKRKWGIGGLLILAVVMLVMAMGGVSLSSGQRSAAVQNPTPVDPYLFGGGRSNIKAIEDLDRSLRRFDERLTEMEAKQTESLDRLNRVREDFERWVETTDIERLAMRAQRRMEQVDRRIEEMQERADTQEFAQAGMQRLRLGADDESPSAPQADAMPQVNPDRETPPRPEPPSPRPEPNDESAPQDLFAGTGMTPRSARRPASEPEAAEVAVRTGLRINGRSLEAIELERQQLLAQETEAEAGAAPNPTRAGAAATERDNIRNNLPIGSIASAVLIHGMDAPTGTGSRGQPVPAIARITDLTILPNMQSMDLVDCHVLIAAYGDISSERAMGRTEDLSCTTADGEIIHTQLQGYIVGPDGKVGVRGPVIHRNGELVVRSIQSGVLSGLGQMFGGRRRGLTISTTGSLAQQDFGEAAEEGIGRGVGTALQNISEYYLELAESIFPVINVDAGTPIDIVITGQADLES